MEKVLSLTTLDEQQQARALLEYWLSRPAEERIAEVERLRRNMALRGEQPDGYPQGLCRTLLLVERERG